MPIRERAPGTKAPVRIRGATDGWEKKQSSVRGANSRPSLPIERYAGTYKEDWYGTATITHENGKLTLALDHTPSMVADLEQWQYDTFKARWRDRRRALADAFVTFALKPDGSIERMTMATVSPLSDFSFD